ncbi:MAG: alkaline phosphatase D family protein [Ilumatobacteraceae bacterium]
MFPSGVASGDVTDSSVVIWTRVAAQDVAVDSVEWVVRANDDRIVAGGTAAIADTDDRTVQLDVDGLEPGTDYTYHFTAAGETVSGRTRTLPRHADQVRFVVACCSRWGWPGFDRCSDIAAERPDFVLHLGDSIYEIGEVPPSGEPTDPPWACHTLDDYRRRHRQHRSHPALQRLLGSVPLIAIWDDHEVVDNAPDGATASRRHAGQQAWREYTPMRQEQSAASIDRFVSIGGILDLALVDARFSGRESNASDGPGDAGSGGGHLLDDVQWGSLTDFADNATAPWFVVANQVQVGPMTLLTRPAIAWPPWRRIVNPDQWDGYPNERARLYETVGLAAGRAVVLSGDLHSGWSRTLTHDGHTVAHEFTSPSISGESFATSVRRQLPLPAKPLAAWLRTINRGIDHLDLMRHGYLVCDVTREQFTTTFVTHDGGRHTISLSADRTAPVGSAVRSINRA